MKIKTNIAFKSIILQSFCVIFITHAYKINIIKPNGKQQ